jgi:hypothetical protein
MSYLKLCCVTLSLALFACSPEAPQPPKEVLTVIQAMVDVLTNKKTPKQISHILEEDDSFYPTDPRIAAMSFGFSNLSSRLKVEITGSFERRDIDSPFALADANINIHDYSLWSNDYSPVKVDSSFYTQSLGLTFVSRFKESELAEEQQRTRYRKYFGDEEGNKMTAADLRAYYAKQPAYYTFEKPSDTGTLLFQFAAYSDEPKYPSQFNRFKIIHKVKPLPIGT